MSSVADLLREGTAALADAGTDRPRAEARLLLQHAMAVTAANLVGHPTEEVRPDAAGTYLGLIGRRRQHEPIAYLVGRQEFWSLPFEVGKGVLVPRPDTETIVQAVLRRYSDRKKPWRLLDIGVGSGCLLLSLLRHYDRATGVGTDTSAAALAFARRNAERLGVDARCRLVETCWTQGLAGPFDIVVSNPPYIEGAEIPRLQPEVSRFEPLAALDGGPDGLDAYRAILPAACALMADSGALLLEVGVGQATAVLALGEALFRQSAVHQDLAGIARCIEFRLQPD